MNVLTFVLVRVVPGPAKIDVQKVVILGGMIFELDCRQLVWIKPDVPRPDAVAVRVCDSDDSICAGSREVFDVEKQFARSVLAFNYLQALDDVLCFAPDKQRGFSATAGHFFDVRCRDDAAKMIDEVSDGAAFNLCERSCVYFAVLDTVAVDKRQLVATVLLYDVAVSGVALVIVVSVNVKI